MKPNSRLKAGSCAALIVALSVLMGAPSFAAAPSGGSTAWATKKSAAVAPFLSIVPRELGSFSRIVFDWDNLVDYQVERDGADLILRFNSSSLLEPIAAGTEKPIRFREIVATTEGNVTTVRIRAVKAGSSLRHFQRGNLIIVDLLDGAAKDEAARPAWATHDVTPIDKVARVGSKPKAASPEAPSVIATTPQENPVPPPTALPSLTLPRLGSATAVQPPATNSNKAAAIKTEPMPAKESPAEARSIKTASAAEPTETAPPPAPKPLNAVAPPVQAAYAALPAPASPIVRVTAEAIEAGVRLGFPFEREAGLAVFERLGYLWIVFDGKYTVDLSRLDASGPLSRAFLGAATIEDKAASGLRLALAPKIGAQVVRTDNSWFVELTNVPPRPLHAIDARVEPGTNGAAGRVILPLTGASAALALSDPEVGDRLIVVPSTTPGSGVAEARSFVQFKLLASAQGIALSPTGEQLDVISVASGVEIKAGDALVLSRQRAAPNSGSDGVAASEDLPIVDATKLLDYEVWRHKELGKFNAARQTLQNAAAKAGGAERTARRIDLARFLFAHGLAADALGVMERIVADDAGVEKDPIFLALRGATRLLAGRFEEAAADLEIPALDNDADIALWRGALAASHGDFEAADTAFSAASMAFENLPPDFKRRFSLLAAQAALAVKNVRRAERFLVELKMTDEAVKPSEVAEIAYLEAQLAEQNGKQKDALGHYEKLGEKRDGPVGVRAAYASVELKLERGEIQPDEAIAEFERLRTIWRGDAYEQQVLRRLAGLYTGKKDYMNALTALRDAVERFPSAPGTPQMRDQMHAMMRNLFVGGAADALSPIEALGLYYEFEDSAPTGAEGGRIVEGLAMQLMAIDLPDRAAMLLRKQVGKLEGEDKARVGERLAEAELLDGKPEKALKALKETEAEMAAPLRFERQRTAARAQNALGHPKDGLALLDGDNSREAALLRIELYWDDQDWPEVAKRVDQIYAAGSLDPATLKPEDHMRIMRGTVARALVHDTEGLVVMRKNFGALMKQTAYAGTFEFITGTMAQEGVDMKELPKILANLDGIDGITGKPAKTVKK